MATRADYRADLKDKILGLEDEGYGDFEYTDLELNTYLELAVIRLFPAVYKRVSQNAVTVTAYGNQGKGKVTGVTAPDRVYMVEEATELTPVRGWEPRPTSLVNLPLDVEDLSTVNVYYYDAYTLPADDVTDAAVPTIYTPLVVLGALVEALESRHDTGARPDASQGHQETSLIDRLMARYERAKEDLAMSLPAVVA